MLQLLKKNLFIFRKDIEKTDTIALDHLRKQGIKRIETNPQTFSLAFAPIGKRLDDFLRGASCAAECIFFHIT